LIDNPGGLRYQWAFSYRDLYRAYSLVYKIFLQHNFIEPSFAAMRIRDWELNKETATIIAKTKNNVVGVISLAPEIPGIGLPSEWLYPDEIDEIRTSSHLIAEACNNAIDDPYRNYSISIEFCRCMLAFAWYLGIDKIIAVINKSHKSFYEFLFMTQIGGEKSYSDTKYDPVILVCSDCNMAFDYFSSDESDNGTADSYLRDFLLFKNPYCALMPEWGRKARNVFKRQRIRERFLDEMRNSLVNSVIEDMHGDKNREGEKEIRSQVR
jgi:hypothetical protein